MGDAPWPKFRHKPDTARPLPLAVDTRYYDCVSNAEFRFYGELNDFLPPDQRQKTVSCVFKPPQSVKHLIESMGVPHPEVGQIVVRRRAVDFHYLVDPADRVAVYPQTDGLGFSEGCPLRPPAPAQFVLDNHLGSLARYMRLVGLDTRYPTGHCDDATLADIAHEENRVLLSRDRRLLMRRVVTHGYCPRSTDGWQQLREVIARFRLQTALKPWSRCARCNGLLEAVRKEDVLDRLEPKTRQYYQKFHRCRACGQIYWKGSHFDKLKRSMALLLDEFE